MPRRYTMRAKCGHEGCAEFAIYEAETRKDSDEQYRKYGSGQWRCSRHSSPDDVLSEANPLRTIELNIYEEKYGRFWGTDRASSGLVTGPGFKAFASDFPPGTKVRVTAEIILPND